MSGETDLDILLATMNPVLAQEAYVFVTVPALRFAEMDVSNVEAMVREPEGITLILREDIAVATGFDTGNTFAKITLQVHSSLEAVGLTAKVSAALTSANISANVVAGYYHDHIYVAAGDGERAVALLQAFGN